MSTCLLTSTVVPGATLNPSGSGFACPSGPMKSSSSHSSLMLSNGKVTSTMEVSVMLFALLTWLKAVGALQACGRCHHH